jgi:small subunit ribosomal protein S6
MRQYETAFLLSPKLSEEETASFITQMAEVISQKKGKMIKEDRWGKRRMAYPIKRFEEAFYVIFLYEADPDVPYELERRFKQTESVLRFLTVKKESKENKRKKKKRMLEEAPSALEGEGLGEKEEGKENLSPDETGKEEM